MAMRGRGRSNSAPGAEAHDQNGAEDDTPLAAILSCHPVAEECGSDGREEDGGSGESELRALGVVEVGLPLWDGLEAVEEVLII